MYKTLTTILKPFDTIVTTATTTSSTTLSLTGIGWIARPISTVTACGLLIGNEVIYEVILQKNIKYKNQYEKYQQPIESFDKLYRKSLQDKVIDRVEYEALWNLFTNPLIKWKRNLF